MNKTIPAVSIIIPMYNVEKYVGECLDSILNQTFTDYEVIAVDDCSTDKTCEVVESYLPRFEGKLQLIRSKKNSGGQVGIPRNKGMRYSIGKYLYFMDSDDVILENALEILYDNAENFDADVVHFENWFVSAGTTYITDKNFWKEINHLKDGVKEPTFLPKNLIERVKLFSQKIFISYAVAYFTRRDFVFQNDIKFPETRMGEDQFFDFELTCYSKKILRIPDRFYVYRAREDSVTHEKLDVPKNIHRWAGALLKTIELLDNFMNKFDELKNNYELKHAMFERFILDFAFQSIIPIYAQVPAHLLDGLVRRELSELGDLTALTAFLFARMNILNVQLIQVQNLLRQQPKEVQDFRRQNEIIQRQQAQIQELQQQLRNVHDIFR